MADRQMSIEDHVTCSICMDLYNDPLALPCMHSFCRNCLAGIVASSMKLQCPECRKDIKLGHKGVDNLVKNFQLASIVDMYRRENGDNKRRQAEVDSRLPLCAQHGVACQMLCTTCKQSVCYKCLTEKHGGHDYELSDRSSGRNSRTQVSEEEGRNCEQHSMPYKLYCNQCDVTVCLACVTQKHQKHHFDTIEDMHQNTMETVNDTLAELDARRRTLRATNKSCRTLAHKIQTDAQQKRQEVTSYFSRLRDMLDRREAFVRAELDKRETETVDAYLRKAEHAQKKETQLNGVINDVKRLLTEDTLRVVQTSKTRSARATELLQNETFDRPPDQKGLEGVTLQTCSIDQELFNIKWLWPKEELKPMRKAPPVPSPRPSKSAAKMTSHSQSAKMTSHSQSRPTLKQGGSVQRGKDWKDGMKDGGPGHFGIIAQTTVEADVYLVRWPNGKTGNYKYAPPYEEEIVPP